MDTLIKMRAFLQGAYPHWRAIEDPRSTNPDVPDGHPALLLIFDNNAERNQVFAALQPFNGAHASALSVRHHALRLVQTFRKKP